MAQVSGVDFDTVGSKELTVLVTVFPAGRSSLLHLHVSDLTLALCYDGTC